MLVANFEADLIHHYRNHLSAMWGEQYIDTIDDRDVLTHYFDSFRRKISFIPRLIETADTFECPALYHNGWNKLRETILSGEDLGPHLSTSHKSPFNQDGLLNEWGIHHFHLGTEPDSKNPTFVARTSVVVFGYVCENVFYAISAQEHRPSPWECESLIGSLHRNWPQLITRYKLVGVSGEQLTAKQRRTLRRKNAQAAITVSDGTVYGPIGGLVSGAGTTFDSVKQADMLSLEIKDLQRGLEMEINSLIPYLRKGGYDNQEEIKTQLRISAVGYQAFFPEYNVTAILIIRQH